MDRNMSEVERPTAVADGTWKTLDPIRNAIKIQVWGEILDCQ